MSRCRARPTARSSHHAKNGATRSSCRSSGEATERPAALQRPAQGLAGWAVGRRVHEARAVLPRRPAPSLGYLEAGVVDVELYSVGHLGRRHLPRAGVEPTALLAIQHRCQLLEVHRDRRAEPAGEPLRQHGIADAGAGAQHVEHARDQHTLARRLGQSQEQLATELRRAHRRLPHGRMLQQACIPASSRTDQEPAGVAHVVRHAATPPKARPPRRHSDVTEQGRQGRTRPVRPTRRRQPKRL